MGANARGPAEPGSRGRDNAPRKHPDGFRTFARSYCCRSQLCSPRCGPAPSSAAMLRRGGLLCQHDRTTSSPHNTYASYGKPASPAARRTGSIASAEGRRGAGTPSGRTPPTAGASRWHRVCAAACSHRPGIKISGQAQAEAETKGRPRGTLSRDPAGIRRGPFAADDSEGEAGARAGGCSPEQFRARQPHRGTASYRYPARISESRALGTRGTQGCGGEGDCGCSGRGPAGHACSGIPGGPGKAPASPPGPAPARARGHPAPPGKAPASSAGPAPPGGRGYLAAPCLRGSLKEPVTAATRRPRCSGGRGSGQHKRRQQWWQPARASAHRARARQHSWNRR